VVHCVQTDPGVEGDITTAFPVNFRSFLSLFWTMFIYTELYDWLVDDLGQVFTKLAVADLVNGAKFGNLSMRLNWAVQLA
jgi:flagellar biosynthesis protein FliR